MESRAPQRPRKWLGRQHSEVVGPEHGQLRGNARALRRQGAGGEVAPYRRCAIALNRRSNRGLFLCYAATVLITGTVSGQLTVLDVRSPTALRSWKLGAGSFAAFIAFLFA